MDEDKTQNSNVTPQSSNPPKADEPDEVVQVGSISKEAERPVSAFVESSEKAPEISAELKDYVAQSEQPVPEDKDIIKASGENVPVSNAPAGIVQLPAIPERKQAEMDLKFGPREGNAWKGQETIRELDRSAFEVLRARVRELKEKAA